MAAKKTTKAKAKAERPLYDNKAVAPAKRQNAAAVRIRVIRAHDGLEVGETYMKPATLAKTLVNLGYWEIIG